MSITAGRISLSSCLDAVRVCMEIRFVDGLSVS